MAEWNFISDDTGTYKECPKGQVKHNWEWNKRDENDDDPGEDVMEIRQNTSMTPGSDDYLCDSDCCWQNDWQLTENLWEKSNFDNVDLFDSDPDGGGEGTVGVSVGYSGASLNWSFSTDGNIDKHINGQNVRWDVNGFYSGELTVTQELEPGSVIVMDDSPCSSSGVKDYFTYLNTEGHFVNSLTGDKYYLYYAWDLYFENYCQD